MNTHRRTLLVALGAVALYKALPVAHAQSGSTINTAGARMLAAWQQANGHFQVGVLNLKPDTPEFFQVQLAVDLPTRPHGLMHLQGDDYLVVARRPGDWMMCLNIRSGEVSRTWQDEDRHLNGHSAMHGDFVYTTETDVFGASGVLGVRDRHTFELIDVWPTHGRDPHEMLVFPQGGLGIDEPFLLVANGGIQTHADMGRTQLNQLPMDSSVVAMHPRTGKVLNKWTVSDSRLSLRHMAVHAKGVVGIAMQAHHSTAAHRHVAPVLALLDEKGLRVVGESAGMKGYAGDIAATAEGFVISCTKNNSAAQFDVRGNLLDTHVAESACALAARGGQVWLGHQPALATAAIELDNHWLALGSPV